MLELYQAEGCPYSQRARRRLSELGVSYVIHNPRSKDGTERNEQTRGELRSISGQDSIPFLVDHGRGETLGDTDEIVAYLDEHYD